MRLLFDMDNRDYAPNGTRFSRPSVRGIVVRGERLLLVYSQKYGFYKFPGGGIEPGETQAETLCREVREETGMTVRPETVRPYGYVHRAERGLEEDVFEQDNFYYFCEVTPEAGQQALEAYEIEGGFVPVYVTPEEAVRANRRGDHPEQPHRDRHRRELEREARVLELLIEEGYFK